jgi:hypothetical protein
MTINVPNDQATTVVSFTAADPQGRIVAVLAGVWVGSHSARGTIWPSDPAEYRTSVRLPHSLHISPHTCRFKLLGRRDLVLGLSGLQRGRGAAAAEERASNAPL